MKLVFQRVASASVTADGVPCGAIGPGAVLLLGVETGDGEREARFLAEKAAGCWWCPILRCVPTADTDGGPIL